MEILAYINSKLYLSIVVSNFFQKASIHFLPQINLHKATLHLLSYLISLLFLSFHHSFHMSDICESLNFIIAYFANNNSLSNTEITFLESLYKPTKSREEI